MFASKKQRVKALTEKLLQIYRKCTAQSNRKYLRI